MKRKDLLLIAVVVVLSGIISYFVSNVIFTTPKDRQQTVEVVDPITSEFSQPDKAHFNNTALDPTQLIKIGNSTNNNPFAQ